MKKSKNRTTVFLTLIIIIAVMVIGYTALQTTLNILGNTTVKGNSWDVHWANVQVSDGSTTDVITPATITSPTQVEFNINLNAPGDYYEFTVDAVNAGTVDAMVDIVSKKVFNSSNVEIQLPNYLLYEVTYPEGIPVETNQLLAANSSETIKVRVEYKRDITADELVTTNTSIKFRISTSYKQSNDATVIPVRSYSYSFLGSSSVEENTIIGDIYSNINEVNSPYFIRHTTYNNRLYTSELGIKYNNNTYYFPALEKESYLNVKPLYLERKSIFAELFGINNCGNSLDLDACSLEPDYCYSCTVDNITITAYSSGIIEANGLNDSYFCKVYLIGKNAASRCGEPDPSS